MASFMPVTDNNLLKAVMIDIIKIIGNNSVIAYKNPLNTEIIDSGIDLLLYRAIDKTPKTQTIVMSFFLKIDISIKIVKIYK